MKRNRYIIGALAATLALASCQQDELGTAFNTDPDAVHITASVGEGIVISRSNPVGDADAQKVFNPGDQIGVSAGTQGVVTYTLTDDATTWTPQTEQYLRWDSPTMNFTAYYPVGENIDASDGIDGTATLTTDARNFALPHNQQTIELIEKADYMTVVDEPIARPQSGSAVSLRMKRRTARVIVRIKGFGDEYAEAERHVKELYIATCAVAYKNGNIVTRTNNVGIASYGTKSKSDDTYYAQGSTFTALVLPDVERPDKGFIRLTDGTDKILNVYGIPAHQAGFSYTYDVTVGKNGITIGNISIDPWTNGGAITGGEADMQIEADAATHTVTTTKPGLLEAELSADPAFLNAIVNTTAGPDQGKLLLKGPINNADITALRKWAITHINETDGSAKDDYALRHLDMSGVTGMETLPGWAFGSEDPANTIRTLATIALPTSLKEIDSGAFYGCTALTTVSGLDNVGTIGASAFKGCTTLTNVSGLSNVGTIGTSAFYGCSLLNLGEGSLSKVTFIGIGAFYGCTALTTVNAPDVASVGNAAFRHCINLGTVTLGKLAAIPDNQMIFVDAKVTTLNLPACTSLGNSALFGTIGTINLPACTSLANSAFSGATITTLRLTTSGNITMGDEAFRNFTGSSGSTLVLHENKKQGGGATPQVVEGNKWGNVNNIGGLYQWDTITYEGN